MINSAYGILASPTFRLFSVAMAEAITLSSQTTILWSERSLNRFMNKILKTKSVDYCIAIDTDSVMFRMDSLVKKSGKTERSEIIDMLAGPVAKKCDEVLTKGVEELCSLMGVENNQIRFERDVISDRGIFVAKKRYILQVWDSEGVRYSEPDMKMMGIEAVRSSTPMSCRDKIRDALKVILNEDNPALIKFIEEFREEFNRLPVEDIAFPRGVQEITKYVDRHTGLPGKRCPIHVKGVIHHNRLLKETGVEAKYKEIAPGDKIKFVYMYEPNPIHNNTIAFFEVLPEEFGLNKFIDRSKQFEKTFLQPIRNIVGVIGWTTEEVPTIEDLFS